jgi:hypothetical protein
MRNFGKVVLALALLSPVVGQVQPMKKLFEYRDKWLYNYETLKDAIFSGKLAAVKYMVEKKKANVNEVDDNGRMSLHHAAWNHKGSVIVEYLLNNGAKVDVRDKTEWEETPLHTAASIGNCDVGLKLILIGKADTNATDAKGNTPLHLAMQPPNFDTEICSYLNLICILLTTGARLDIKNKYGYTPFDSLEKQFTYMSEKKKNLLKALFSRIDLEKTEKHK